MAVNKVVINTENGAETLIDLTEDNVTAETLAEGATAHDASGARIMGTMKAGGDPVQSDWSQTDTTAPDYIKNKPFGQMSGDTITWDGDWENASITGNAPFYPVSDLVPTAENLVNGAFITLHTGGDIMQAECYFADHPNYDPVHGHEIVVDGDIIRVFDDKVFIALKEINGYPAGIYFYSDLSWGDDTWVESMTIPGFGETTFKTIPIEYMPKSHQFGVIGKGDTLEWEANKNDPFCINTVDGGTCYEFYKVSDIVLSEDDLQNGAILTTYRGYDLSSDDTFCTYEDNMGQTADGALYITNWEFSVLCYPENSVCPAGVYFAADFNVSQSWIKGITIPGFGKFPINKPIEQEYLPTPLRIGETVGMINTLSWDGNTDGLMVKNGTSDWYFVSNTAVTVDDLANGIFVKTYMAYGGLYCSVPFEGFADIDTSNPDDIFINAYDENMELIPIVRFTPEGVYVRKSGYVDYAGVWVEVRIHSLTIPGFDKFAVPSYKTIDKKYLPKINAVADATGSTVTAEEFNALLSALRAAGYLAT